MTVRPEFYHRRIAAGWAFVALAVSTLFYAGCGGAPPATGTASIEAVPVANQSAAGDASAPPSESGTADPQAGGTEAGPKSAEPQDSPEVSESQDGSGEEKNEAGDQAKNPFPHRIEVPEFPRDATWLNTSGPLRKRDLKGKFVLLDFWTYCCINCMHILPELKKLERAYPNELVVIGVHSAKFEAEEDRENVEQAILRYEIEHPVVNDSAHGIWNTYGVNSWPTVLLIDPEGHAVWGRSGEITFEDVDPLLKMGMEYYRAKKTLDPSPVHFERLASRQEDTPLRFPGKVVADEAGGRLFISDSNHNRIVVAGLDGKLQQVIGTGRLGRQDGPFDKATFDHPQGMFLEGDVLYIADTENHMLRKANLKEGTVSTIAGTGAQSRNSWPGLDPEGRGRLPDRWVGNPKTMALNSPWDLWVHDGALYIAMAGPHQIWRMPLDETEIGPFAGNGREDIVDGPLLPRTPYERGYASFAQPSGLSSDGKDWLYVADSEGSSIRAVPFDTTEEVKTVVGTSELPQARLFTFGDVDGEREQVRLQHALAVVYHEGKLYVADTYNNKIKEIDAESGKTQTLAGDGKPGNSDDPAQFDEPAGLTLAKGTLYIADTNNHAIRTFDLANGTVGTFVVQGLTSPPRETQPAKPSFADAAQEEVTEQTVQLVDGKIQFEVALQLPKGWKINDLAPLRFWVEAAASKGPLDRPSLGSRRADKPSDSFSFSVPAAASGTDEVIVSLQYYYCQDGGEGLCKIGSVVWKTPIRIVAEAPAKSVSLKHSVPE